MDSVFLFLLAFFFLGWVGSFMTSWHYFRQLVDYEFLINREQWEKDGRPEGSSVSRREIGFWNLPSWLSTSSQYEVWGSSRPEWMVGDLAALNGLRQFQRWSRLSQILGLLMVLSALIFFFYLDPSTLTRFEFEFQM